MKSEILFSKESTEGVAANQVTAIDYDNEAYVHSAATVLKEMFDLTPEGKDE